MAWLRADAVPFAVFVNAAGLAVRADVSITPETVADGLKALAQNEESAVDPVCGMAVNQKGAAGGASFQGKTYYFCGAACKDRFEKEPQKYLSQ
ncbi:YHS domain-containing protein [candidate division WOR-3 bacterium]|nr:YHS domain-containing protein [candidate division WOR-3 bacterium]